MKTRLGAVSVRLECAVRAGRASARVRWARLAMPAALFAVCSAPACAQDAARSAQAVQAFEKVRTVLQHPRCQNCHIPGDAPLQRDQGVTHSMNVKRGEDGLGAAAMECASCHQSRNLPAEYGPHALPGAPNWHLPPAHMKMVFIGLSSGELCRVLRNPTSNGGKTAAQLIAHVAADKLVLWGWTPGGNRAPVAVPHAEFVAAFKDWVAGGMPCPAH